MGGVEPHLPLLVHDVADLPILGLLPIAAEARVVGQGAHERRGGPFPLRYLLPLDLLKLRGRGLHALRVPPRGVVERHLRLSLDVAGGDGHRRLGADVPRGPPLVHLVVHRHGRLVDLCLLEHARGHGLRQLRDHQEPHGQRRRRPRPGALHFTRHAKQGHLEYVRLSPPRRPQHPVAHHVAGRAHVPLRAHQPGDEYGALVRARCLREQARVGADRLCDCHGEG
mmetsp:Transcript_94320/g.272615  ORF Transcript_94320/g.272615 Transcript_94320/m.272615 type:complete len:225 (-) Transcript_94320:551-1225(-)